jgi:hypothetical protein
MSLKLIGNIYGDYHSKYVDNIYMTDNETSIVGQAYHLSSGRWTEANGVVRIQAICYKATTGGTDQLGYMELVKPGDIIEGDYTGTPNAAFLAGCESATLANTDGQVLDASDVTSGHLLLLNVDTANKKAQFVATKNFLVNDTIGSA